MKAYSSTWIPNPILKKNEFPEGDGPVDYLIRNLEIKPIENYEVDLRFLFTTSSGVYLYDHGRIIWLLHGFCYGLCHCGGNFYVTQELQYNNQLHRYDIGRILRFTIHKDQVCDLAVSRAGLNYGLHQMACRDDEIHFTDCVLNKVVIFKSNDTMDTGYSNTKSIDYDKEASIKGRHLNSVMIESSNIYLLAHNDSTSTGRFSSYYKLNLAGRLIECRYIDGRCAHDISKHNGHTYFCNSDAGTVQNEQGVVFLSPDGIFTRGLYLGTRYNVIGGSERVHRSRREKTHALLYITDPEFQILGCIVIGAVDKTTMGGGVKVIYHP